MSARETTHAADGTTVPDGPLKVLLRPEFEPASNLRGRLAFADGRYLLPDLRTGRVLHLGLPGGTDARAFVERLEPGARATLLSTDPEVAADVSAEAARRGAEAPELETRTLSIWKDLSLPAGSVPVAVVGAGAGAPAPADYPELAAELRRLVKDGGAVAFEARGFADAFSAGRLEESLAGVGFASEPPLWLLSISGSLRIAVEEGDLSSARQLLQWLGRGTSSRRRAFRVGIGLLDRVGLLGAFLGRHRLFLFRKQQGAGGGEDDDGEGLRNEGGEGLRREEEGASAGKRHAAGLWPPPYMRSVLEEAGLDADRYRFGFHVHGRYDSNKVAFFLFDRDNGGRPRHLIKCTRAPSFNHRLENEHRCLRLLKEKQYLPPEASPEPTILTYRAGLAMLGMRFVPGRPMRQVTSAAPDCPLVRQVVDRLETLGAASARRDPRAAEVVRTGIERLHEHFRDIYPVPQVDGRFLRRQVAALLDGADELPLVFQHADPGIWNIFVEGEHAVILDWESGDPAGIPLWDLFYFLRSVGSWHSKLRGDRDLIRSYEQKLLDPSAPLARFQTRVVERYRRRLAIAPELVEALFYTCWMHRSLREAMQMRPDAVDKGVYYRLLLRSIELRG